MPRKLPRNVIDVFGNFAFLTRGFRGEIYLSFTPQFAFPRSDRCRDPGSGARHSLYEWYQDEALMEGKKISTSIIHLAIDLGEIEGWRSKEQEENPRLGWNFLFSRSCKKRKRGKRLLLI